MSWFASTCVAHVPVRCVYLCGEYTCVVRIPVWYVSTCMVRVPAWCVYTCVVHVAVWYVSTYVVCAAVWCGRELQYSHGRAFCPQNSE